jgi:FixJ family two-component response regulator
MNEPVPTVFVVDDDPSVRKGIARLLKSTGYRSETFPSAAEFLARWQPDPVPGCALLDIMMPGIDGLELQRRLLDAPHRLPIVFITGHGDIPSSVRAMKAGAVDFLPKPFKDKDLFRAVREAIARDARDRAERAERDAVATRYANLTPREREVMALVVRGMLNKQIAYELGLSEKTVKIHRGRVTEKMKVQSVADLVVASQKLPLL